MKVRNERSSNAATASAHADGGRSDDRDYLTIKEFAERSGLSLSTVRRYLADGRLPKIQPGGHRCRVLIPRDVLGSYHNQTAAPDDMATRQPKIDTKAVDASSPTNAPNHHGPTPRWRGRR